MPYFLNGQVKNTEQWVFPLAFSNSQLQFVFWVVGIHSAFWQKGFLNTGKKHSGTCQILGLLVLQGHFKIIKTACLSEFWEVDIFIRGFPFFFFWFLFCFVFLLLLFSFSIWKMDHLMSNWFDHIFCHYSPQISIFLNSTAL